MEARPFWSVKGNKTKPAQRKVDAQENNLLVNNVFDVVMHALVRPSFVWLYVKGHLCKNTREHGC